MFWRRNSLGEPVRSPRPSSRNVGPTSKGEVRDERGYGKGGKFPQTLYSGYRLRRPKIFFLNFDG